MPAKALALTLTLISLPVIAAAADNPLQIPNYENLARKASNTVNVTINPALMRLASQFMDKSDADDADTVKLINGIHSIQIRHFEFDADHAYSKEDVESVRSQLKAPEWHPIIQSHDNKKQDDVEIFARVTDNHPAGLAILVTEPREFTIVDISGHVDERALGALGGQMGIPKTDVKPAN